jgi:hypothetical protein
MLQPPLEGDAKPCASLISIPGTQPLDPRTARASLAPKSGPNNSRLRTWPGPPRSGRFVPAFLWKSKMFSQVGSSAAKVRTAERNPPLLALSSQAIAERSASPTRWRVA